MPLEWAKILVNAYINDEWNPNDSEEKLQKEWINQAQSYLKEQSSKGNSTWMLENCLNDKDGAGATFCGITFKDKENWVASILGDSCLVLVDENNDVKDIIASKEGKFDNRPDYFDSFKERRGKVKTKGGFLTPQQKILLVSDPFSELFQKKVQESPLELNTIINQLLSLKNFEDYLKHVDDFRKLYKMHNDDSTLVIIEYDENDDMTVEDQMSLEDLVKKECKDEEMLWQKAKSKKTIDSIQAYREESKLKLHEKEAKEILKEISKKQVNNEVKEETPESLAINQEQCNNTSSSREDEAKTNTNSLSTGTPTDSIGQSYETEKEEKQEKEDEVAPISDTADCFKQKLEDHKDEIKKLCINFFGFYIIKDLEKFIKELEKIIE
jgi:mRNA-degrading endonuclease RelE of RelBE toxin-antitoxin system